MFETRLRIICFAANPTSSATIQARILPLMSELIKKGNHVTLVSPVVDRVSFSKVLVRGFKCGRRRPPSLLFPLFYIVMILYSVACLAEPYDVVIASKNTYMSGILGMAFSSFKRIPLVTDIDDYEFSTSFYHHLLLKEPIARAITTKSTALVVASKALFRLYSERRQCRYIPNSTDLDFFSPRNVTSRRGYTLVWVGTFFFLSEWRLVLSSFARVRVPAILVMIGDGPDLVLAKELVAMLGISERVIFTGELDRKSIREHLADADVGLVPLGDTLFNTCKCPIKLFEFMAMELPIIGTDVGEVGAMIREARCGLASAPRAESIAESIECVLKNFAGWQEAGKRGRIFLSRNQNWISLSRKYDELFQGLRLST